jgi:transglycosylase-like protein with SLT domain
VVVHVAVAATARAGAAGARVATGTARASAGAVRAGASAARGATAAARGAGSAARATRPAGRTVGKAARGGSQTGRGLARSGSRGTGRAHRLQRGGGPGGGQRSVRPQKDPTLRRLRKNLGDRRGGDRSRPRRSGLTGRGPSEDPQDPEAQPERTTDAGTHARRGLRGAVATARMLRHPVRSAGRLISPTRWLRRGRGQGVAKGVSRGPRHPFRRWLIILLVFFLVFGMVSSMPLLLRSFSSGNDPGNAGASLTNGDTMTDAFVEAGVPEEYADDFVATATLGIDPRLVAAVAWHESIHFDPDVIACDRDSPDGAQGIMQFMPDTARERQVDPCQPGEAITAGARYLMEIYGKFRNWDVALAGYNAGPYGEVESCRCVPTNGETEDYVPAVNGQWEEYKRSVPEPRYEGGRPTGANPGGPMGSTERYTEAHITANMQALLDESVPLFGRGRGIGCYDPSRSSGEHPLGRACDFIISSPLNTRPEPEWLEHGWREACWFVENAEALHVRYVIWQKLIWEESNGSEPGSRCNANREGDGWTDYTRYDPNGSLQQNHFDHIHVTVN